jgi:hypothetical protein
VLTCCANSKEHRRNANTPRGSRRVTGGIDWASDDHAVAVVDPDGVAVKRCTFEHTGAGCARWSRRCKAPTSTRRG